MLKKPSNVQRDEFVSTYGTVWEHSPWIAERTWSQGIGEAHDAADSLHAAMCQVIDEATEAEILALLNAHPDLADRIAVVGELTDESRSEQASAGLDQCTAEEFAEFERLNAAYRARFDFPFILAVKGRDRTQILAAFASRISNDRATEFSTAISEVKKIALLRLQDLMP